jgi:hypothetical protein
MKALTLSRAFVAVPQLVEIFAMLWIKEHQWRAMIRQRLQQHQRVATLNYITPVHQLSP